MRLLPLLRKAAIFFCLPAAAAALMHCKRTDTVSAVKADAPTAEAPGAADSALETAIRDAQGAEDAACRRVPEEASCGSTIPVADCDEKKEDCAKARAQTSLARGYRDLDAARTARDESRSQTANAEILRIEREDAERTLQFAQTRYDRRLKAFGAEFAQTVYAKRALEAAQATLDGIVSGNRSAARLKVAEINARFATQNTTRAEAGARDGYLAGKVAAEAREDEQKAQLERRLAELQLQIEAAERGADRVRAADLRIEEGEARLRSAEATVAFRTEQLERLRGVAGIVAGDDITQAETAKTAAEASVRPLKTALEKARAARQSLNAAPQQEPETQG